MMRDSADAVEVAIKEGIGEAMNRFNGRSVVQDES